MTIRYSVAERARAKDLRRMLRWTLRGDPAAPRIEREAMSTKAQILNALVWTGAIS